MAHDVFISYSHQDKTTADATCATLEAGGIRCWIAPRDVPPGDEWAGAIVDAIANCHAMVLIFSSNTNGSKQIKREVQQAFDGGKPVLPLRIENVTPERSLAYYMGPVHWLDALTPPLEHHLQSLTSAVGALLSANLSKEERPAPTTEPVVSRAFNKRSSRSSKKVWLVPAVLFAGSCAATAIGFSAYQFGWFGLPPANMRIPIGFKSADFRLNYLAGELGTCDRSPLPIPVPINSDGLANLALLKQATPLASSVFPGFPDRHSITYLNDGWYNNCRSWIPASMPAWAEIDLGEIFVVQKVRFGSEHEKYWRDRAATEFTIRISEVGGSNWTVVYTHHADQGAVTGTQEFWFQPQNARYVRLDFNATRDGDPVRIDELEIYGRRTPAP